jgi:sugar lactone lactonase YvrE
VRDTNGDGDARDGGESELILTGQPGFGDTKWPTVTTRVVLDGGGNEVVRELLVSSLTRSTRISRVLEDGSARDIARAVEFGPEDVVAEPDGDIYVVVQGAGDADTAPTFTIYRLTPVPLGEAGATVSAGDTSASPSSTAGGLGEVTEGEPRIAYTLESFGEEETSRIMVVHVDGSAPTELIPGEHNSYFCQSADGSLIGFWSDEEVPHEAFVYVANADGTGRRKISDDVGQFWCGFSNDEILVQGRAGSAPIFRHDLATGEETELLSGADWLEPSPDGGQYLAAIEGSGGATLEILDATSGDRLTLHGPIAEGHFSSFAWAPDGSLVAYAIGPQPSSQGPQQVGAHEIYVVDPAGGEPRLVSSVDGYEPRLALSVDGRHLLVRTPSEETGQGPLMLVEVETGEARAVADDALFGDWHPSDPASFAYATPGALYVQMTAGGAREVLQVPAVGICPECEDDAAPPGEWGWGEWMGWSPDGRYVGLPDFAPVVAVVEVESGDLRILTGDLKGDAFVLGARWLR